EAPRSLVEEMPWLEGELDEVGDVSPDEGRVFASGAQPVALYHGDTGRVVDDVKRWAGDGWRVVLGFEGHGPAHPAGEVMRGGGAGIGFVETVTAAPRPGEPLVTVGALGNGFLDETARLAVLTGADVAGGRGASTRDMRKMPSRRRNTIDPLELRAGDF